jgi:hypothetical protein
MLRETPATIELLHIHISKVLGFEMTDLLRNRPVGLLVKLQLERWVAVHDE